MTIPVGTALNVVSEMTTSEPPGRMVVPGATMMPDGSAVKVEPPAVMVTPPGPALGKGTVCVPLGPTMTMPVGAALIVVSEMTSGGSPGRIVVPGLRMMPPVGSATIGPPGALVIVIGPGLLLGGLFGLPGGRFGSCVGAGWPNEGEIPGRVGLLGGFTGGLPGSVGGSWGLLGGCSGSVGGSSGLLGGSSGSSGSLGGSFGGSLGGSLLGVGGLAVGALVGGDGGSAGVACVAEGLGGSFGVVTGTAGTLALLDKKFPVLFKAMGGSSRPKYANEHSPHSGPSWRIAGGIIIRGLYSPGNTTEHAGILTLHSGWPYQALYGTGSTKSAKLTCYESA